jgi:hypothetical protein
MGSSDSKPILTSKDRAIRELAKSDLVNRRKKEIEEVQIQYANSVRDENKNSIVNVKEIANFFKATETAKTQLDRSGDSLIKADLIAIVIALQPDMKYKVDKLNDMRLSDLNVLIRSIIYDPSRILALSEKSEKVESSVKNTTLSLL